MYAQCLRLDCIPLVPSQCALLGCQLSLSSAWPGQSAPALHSLSVSSVSHRHGQPGQQRVWARDS